LTKTRDNKTLDSDSADFKTIKKSAGENKETNDFKFVSTSPEVSLHKKIEIKDSEASLLTSGKLKEAKVSSCSIGRSAGGKSCLASSNEGSFTYFRDENINGEEIGASISKAIKEDPLSEEMSKKISNRSCIGES
jgi:hypothetical protein